MEIGSHWGGRQRGVEFPSDAKWLKVSVLRGLNIQIWQLSPSCPPPAVPRSQTSLCFAQFLATAAFSDGQQETAVTHRRKSRKVGLQGDTCNTEKACDVGSEGPSFPTLLLPPGSVTEWPGGLKGLKTRVPSKTALSI